MTAGGEAPSLTRSRGPSSLDARLTVVGWVFGIGAAFLLSPVAGWLDVRSAGRRRPSPAG